MPALFQSRYIFFSLVDGGWQAFSDWSNCTARCGGGTMTRSRDCTAPVPKNAGRKCQGFANETVACNTKFCTGEL